MSLSVILSCLSLLVSVTVAWLTLFRRGNLYMTKPVQIAFLSENGRRPKVFLRTLLYATGKRGYVIEGLYVKLRRRGEDHTFAFWGYGEHEEFKVAGGLRIGEDGVVSNHHFLQTGEGNHFYFDSGDYEIRVYARIVNVSSARLMHKASVTLSEEHATQMHIRTNGVLFTWDPDAERYTPSLYSRERKDGQ